MRATSLPARLLQQPVRAHCRSTEYQQHDAKSGHHRLRVPKIRFLLISEKTCLTIPNNALGPINLYRHRGVICRNRPGRQVNCKERRLRPKAIMLDAAIEALITIAEPTRMLILFGGVILGLVVGVIPGLSGVVGLAILIPFTYGLDPFAAIALLIGMHAVTTNSDLIPAVLFGVPGTVGAAATVIDGHAMAKNGEAGRAFGAGYAASLIGGIAGALLLAAVIPVIRPFVLYMGSPELLAFSIFGL